MKILVTYKSKTGFSKWYAEKIADRVEGSLVEYKDVTVEMMSQYDVVIYGGGIYAGKVNGLNKVKELFDNSLAGEFIVFATGGTPNEVTQEIDKIWKNNLTEKELISLPHFYMQGGICYEKMSVSDRAIMKMVAKALGKKKTENSIEEGFKRAIENSYNITSSEYIEPLVDYLLKMKSREVKPPLKI